MLRTLGASRQPDPHLGRSSRRCAIGILGAVLGLAGGFAIAKGLNALFVAIGIDLPTTSLVIETRTIVVSLAIGIVVTLVSSLVPALRSTRVPPIAALQALEMPRSRRREVAYAALAALLGVAGLAMVVIALFGGASGGSAAGLIGAGAVAVILGVSLFSPTLVRPLAAIAGKPLEVVAEADRPPRAGEHPAQPGQDRGHRGGADDRPRRRRLRHRLRRRASRARSPPRSTTASRASW